MDKPKKTYDYDPELAAMVPLLPEFSIADPGPARDSLGKLVSGFNANIDTQALAIEDLVIPGVDEPTEVSVRVYRPRQAATQTAGLIYLHGGGFVMGSVDTEHASAIALAEQLNIVVLSVDYRLAPEHPYPSALNDCYAALQWLHANAKDYRVDPQRIGVCGQSAGGGLAAALALKVRDLQRAQKTSSPSPRLASLCFQYLGIPELDDRLDSTSMREFIDTPLWNRPNAELSWDYYLQPNYQRGADDVPAHAAPARATDCSDLPPAYVSAMQYDPLRDEAIVYALNLLQAGVAVELHTYPGTFHGSSLVKDAGVSRRIDQEMFDALRRGLKLNQSS